MPDEIAAKYEVRGTLGSGAAGTVLEAFDKRIERRVAIKIVRLPAAADAEAQEARARFRREAQAVGRLYHPNIVQVHDYGEDADTAWMVMELVEGGSLKALLDRGERFPVAGVARIMAETLSALAYSHARGVVHRDIKPGNIMLAAGETLAVKIADFGIARLENSSMTQVGTVMGTPAYMAPEQLRGEPVDHRADIWAAGVLLYQLLTGEKPFEGGFSAVLHKALNTEPAPPSALAATAPRAFDGVVARALSKRPEERYPDAAAFAEAIREAAVPPVPLPGIQSSGDGDATLVQRGGGAPTAGPAGRERRTRGRGPPSSPSRPAPTRAARRPARWLIGGAAAAVVAWFLLRAPEPVVRPEPAREAADRQGLDGPVSVGNPSHEQAERERAAREHAAEAGESERLAREAADRAASARRMQEAAAAAVAAAPCGLIATAVDDQGLTLAGVLLREQENALRRSLAASGIPDRAVRLRLETFEGVPCAAFDVLRPVLAAPDAAPRLAVLDGPRLQDGNRIRLDISLPDSPSAVSAILLTRDDRSSAPLAANLLQSRPLPAGARTVLSEPDWVVGPPFGTDILVVIATDRPLFAQERPFAEPLQSLLADLAPALRTARASGRAALRAAVVETVAATTGPNPPAAPKARAGDR